MRPPSGSDEASTGGNSSEGRPSASWRSSAHARRRRSKTSVAAAWVPSVAISLVRACATMRPGPLTSPTAATKTTLRTLARRWQQLQAELDQLDLQLQKLVKAVAPTLVALPGVGVETAGQLLVTAGDNPQRLGSEAAFAHLCGAAPSRRPRAAPTATG